MENVATGLSTVREEIEGLSARHARVRELAEDERHTIPGSFAPPQKKRNTTSMTSTRTRGTPGYEARQSAHRAIDNAYETGVLPERAGFMLNELVESDRFGLESEYIAAIASDEYLRAWGKKVIGANGPDAVLSADESEAMARVGEAMAQRALAAGEPATGGYAIPLTLDPSILLTSDGSVNPLRDLATVTPISTTKWAGVSSAGVEAKFQAEAAEATDGAPTLGQPTITPQMARIWCPFSIEVGADWGQLATELTKIFADARDQKEAEVFAVGKGEAEIPGGIVTGATKSPVETATKEVVAIADVYSLQESLPPRWQANATWLGTNRAANLIYRMVAAGDTEEAPLMSEDRSEILGRPFREVSYMSSKVTTKKEKVLLYGDVASAFRIIDRVGMSVETVPLVLKEGKPTGQRGLFAFFRVGSKVIVPEAIRALVIKE